MNTMKTIKITTYTNANGVKFGATNCVVSGSGVGIGGGGGGGGGSIAGGGNNLNNSNMFGGKATNIAQLLSPDVETITGLNIPFIKNKDAIKKLPTYIQSLQRPIDESLPVDELDTLQIELETLLSSVAQRYRVLKSEYESLDKDDRRNERRMKHTSIGNLLTGDKQTVLPSTTVASSSSGKRKRDDMNVVRKPKLAATTLIRHTKHAKNSPLNPNTDDSIDYAPTSVPGTLLMAHPSSLHQLQKMIIPKNDTPNKFWLSVEPYCMPLTNEDLRLLNDLLEQYSGPLVPPIPELGPHYSSAWATDDIKDIQHSSHSSNRLKPHNNIANEMLKKADALVEGVTGPLTQRLVSALMEEQLVNNTTDLANSAIADGSNSSSENAHSSAQLNFRSLSMLRNSVAIEKKMKKVLIEQGILDETDFPNDDDEILAEIKRVIAELLKISEYNSDALKQLHEYAREEIKRLEIKRKLDVVDHEILEAYKRTMQNKVRRKPTSIEEQQEIYRLTAEQKALSDQLERLECRTNYD